MRPLSKDRRHGALIPRGSASSCSSVLSSRFTPFNDHLTTVRIANQKQGLHGLNRLFLKNLNYWGMNPRAPDFPAFHNWALKVNLVVMLELF